MKIYRLAADEKAVDTSQVEKAVNSIRVATGVIIQSQKVLQNGNALQYLDTTAMRSQVKSMIGLNQNNLQQYANAAYQIYTNIDIVNDNLRVLQSQPEAAKLIGSDFVTTQTKIEAALATGRYDQIVPVLEQAKQQASSESGISEPAKMM